MPNLTRRPRASEPDFNRCLVPSPCAPGAAWHCWEARLESSRFRKRPPCSGSAPRGRGGAGDEKPQYPEPPLSTRTTATKAQHSTGIAMQLRTRPLRSLSEWVLPTNLFGLGQLGGTPVWNTHPEYGCTQPGSPHCLAATRGQCSQARGVHEAVAGPACPSQTGHLRIMRKTALIETVPENEHGPVKMVPVECSG